MCPTTAPKWTLIKDELLAALADIEPRPAQLPLYITGRLSDTCALGTELDAAYWWDNVRLSVRFKHAIDCLAKDHYSLFLEIGPTRCSLIPSLNASALDS